MGSIAGSPQRRRTLLKFLNSTPARLVTVFLIIQTALLYSSIRSEYIPPSRPLSEVPREFGPWTMVQEGNVDKEIQDVLKADDLLNRVYIAPGSSAQVSLFVASFRTQRNGKTPHSPKNCLPGSGWTQLSSDKYPINVGKAAPIVVNRYVIFHGEERELVFYWYQSRNRVVADEFEAKFWVLADAIRLNRTDTALVRVIVPIHEKDEELATQTGVEFVKAFFGTLQQHLPS
ncbi:MAG TPA: EpsI family protein [Bryobacteraceae bacterium]|nr:EpsI family protein [Bryobacteraceae bacterium]